MRQVVTELDAMNAVYDYIIEQLEGRFKLEYPKHTEHFDATADYFKNSLVRHDVIMMQVYMVQIMDMFYDSLSKCLITGCMNDDKHVAVRECLDLFFDARKLAAEWLKGQGVVPGQSAN
jgi:hypothetical protein